MATVMDNPYRKFKKSFKVKPTGEQVHEFMKKKASAPVKHSGTFHGKSNALGQGGRAAQLKARGVPGGVIGNLARRAQAAPGQKNYHKKKASIPKPDMNELGLAMKKAHLKHKGSPDMKCKMCKTAKVKKKSA